MQNSEVNFFNNYLEDPRRPADPVQELRHGQLQLHQVRPAVQRRPEAQPRHGERQLCQIGGHGREGCDSGRRKKYLKYLQKIFTFTIYMLCMCVTKERKYSTHWYKIFAWPRDIVSRHLWHCGGRVTALHALNTIVTRALSTIVQRRPVNNSIPSSIAQQLACWQCKIIFACLRSKLPSAWI